VRKPGFLAARAREKGVSIKRRDESQGGPDAQLEEFLRSGRIDPVRMSRTIRIASGGSQVVGRGQAGREYDSPGWTSCAIEASEPLNAMTVACRKQCTCGPQARRAGEAPLSGAIEPDVLCDPTWARLAFGGSGSHHQT